MTAADKESLVAPIHRCHVLAEAALSALDDIPLAARAYLPQNAGHASSVKQIVMVMDRLDSLILAIAEAENTRPITMDESLVFAGVGA